MPQLIFNLSADHSNRLINALCELYGYSGEVIDPNNPGKLISNPESRTAFSKRKLSEFLISQVRRYEESLAKKQAESTISEITITEV